jgi:hypothetical protein
MLYYVICLDFISFQLELKCINVPFTAGIHQFSLKSIAGVLSLRKHVALLYFFFGKLFLHRLVRKPALDLFCDFDVGSAFDVLLVS